MLGSAMIGGFILAMIEGTGILINRYSQMFMPQPGLEGTNDIDSILSSIFCFCLEPPPDLNKGKVDLSIAPFFTSSPGQSSTPNNFS
jgi:hypothetical protein